MTNNVVKVDWGRSVASNMTYSRYENRTGDIYSCKTTSKRRDTMSKKLNVSKIARSADTSLVSRERSPFESKRGYNQESPAANGSKM